MRGTYEFQKLAIALAYFWAYFLRLSLHFLMRELSRFSIGRWNIEKTAYGSIMLHCAVKDVATLVTLGGSVRDPKHRELAPGANLLTR